MNARSACSSMSGEISLVAGLYLYDINKPPYLINSNSNNERRGEVKGREREEAKYPL